MCTVLPVLGGKIGIGDCLKRFSTLDRRGGSFHLGDIGRERVRRSFRDEEVKDLPVPADPGPNNGGFHSDTDC